ncbi:hypothetical protein [uncultured Metabacillus sp.]|nr:hypothetical protein [uncultured Metabacillus sp.]
MLLLSEKDVENSLSMEEAEIIPITDKSQLVRNSDIIITATTSQ